MPKFILTIAQGDRTPESMVLECSSKEAARREMVNQASDRLRELGSDIFSKDMELTLQTEAGDVLFSMEIVAIEKAIRSD